MRIDGRAVPFVVVLGSFALAAPGMWGAREPYPAILMPAFEQATGEEGTRSTARPEITVVFTDGEVLDLSAGQLLGPLPRSHWRTTLLAFRPESSGFPWARRGPRASSPPSGDPLLPGRRIRRRFEDAGHRFASEEALSWLRRRVERLGGGRPATELRFDWFEETMRPGEAGPVRGRHLGTFVVDLGR